MTAYDSLLAQARKHYRVPEARTVTAIEELVTSWGGRPFDVTPRLDSLADEFVDSRLLAAAYTITDPELLQSKSTAEEREHSEWPPEPDDGIELPLRDVEWDAVQDELGGLQRLIILIEFSAADPTLVGNFRVHGFGQWVRESLWAATGVLPRDPGSPDASSELYRQGFALLGRPC